jgi:hypothetical protein
MRLKVTEVSSAVVEAMTRLNRDEFAAVGENSAALASYNSLDPEDRKALMRFLNKRHLPVQPPMLFWLPEKE